VTHCGGGYQRIDQMYAVGQGVFLHQQASCVGYGLHDGQHVGLPLLEGLRHGLEFGLVAAAFRLGNCAGGGLLAKCLQAIYDLGYAD
jgi:hypothetical protein